MIFEFNLKWAYPTQNNEFDVFSQPCILELGEKGPNVTMPSFCAGTYISNLINACNIDEIFFENNRQLSEVHGVWRHIAGHEYTIQNYENIENDSFTNYIVSDAMAFPAFCIFKNIRSTLKDIAIHLHSDEPYLWSQSSLIILDHETRTQLVNGFDEQLWERIQHCIDNYMKKYNDLLRSTNDIFGADFYRNLVDCLKTYNDDEHKLIKKYLADKKGRCIATFIEHSNGKKYVAFSGFVDAIDKRIIKWATGKEKLNPFVETARTICRTLGATLVHSNLSTRRYDVENPLPFYIKQGLSLDQIINLGYDSEYYKNLYSCCERKIFGHFNDNTPNGTLYVKLKACGECGLGIIYQWSKGHEIFLRDGLMC